MKGFAITTDGFFTSWLLQGPEVVLPLMEPAQDCALSPATTKHFMTFLVTQSQSETLSKQEGNKDLQHIVDLLLVSLASLNFCKFQVLNGFNRLHWCWRGILLPTGAAEVDHRGWGDGWPHLIGRKAPLGLLQPRHVLRKLGIFSFEKIHSNPSSCESCCCMYINCCICCCCNSESSCWLLSCNVDVDQKSETNVVRPKTDSSGDCPTSFSWRFMQHSADDCSFRNSPSSRWTCDSSSFTCWGSCGGTLESLPYNILDAIKQDIVSRVLKDIGSKKLYVAKVPTVYHQKNILEGITIFSEGKNRPMSAWGLLHFLQHHLSPFPQNLQLAGYGSLRNR